MKKYPYWKVGIGFILCPSVVGLFISFGMIGSAISKNSMEDFLFSLVFIPNLVFLAVFFELIPSFFLSVFCLSLKLRRGWRSYGIVVFVGGVGAVLWNFFTIDPYFIIERYFFDGDRKDLKIFVYFLLGAISSFLAAILVLPKRKIAANAKIETIKIYPRKRVFVGFSLSPMVSAIFFFILMMIQSTVMTMDEFISETLSIYWPLRFIGLVVQAITMSLVAEIFFVIPAFLMAFVVILKKPEKEPRGILFVFVLGGLVATAWNFFPVFLFKEYSEFQALINHEFLSSMPLVKNINIFYWGAITSSIMAMRVLPSSKIFQAKT